MLKFDKEKARAIVQEKHPEYVVVEKHWRYQEKGVNFFWVVVKNVETGKHYKTFYRFVSHHWGRLSSPTSEKSLSLWKWSGKGLLWKNGWLLMGIDDRCEKKKSRLQAQIRCLLPEGVPRDFHAWADFSHSGGEALAPPTAGRALGLALSAVGHNRTSVSG